MSNRNLRVLLTMIALALFFAASTPRATAEDAAALYKAKCAACHGADGVATATGQKLKARDFNSPEAVKMTAAEMIEVTTKGKEKMPAYDKKLTADQIKSLVDYVRSMSKAKK